MLIGLVVNPVAGMGGAVGLKGTDGQETLSRAKELGAQPMTQSIAYRALRSLQEPMRFITGPGLLGQDVLQEAGMGAHVADMRPHDTREDTIALCRFFLDNDVDVIVFCGGDGTARDVLETVQDQKPVIGVPGGVKMYSAVFLHRPEDLWEILQGVQNGQASLGRREVLDIDEERYRQGVLDVRLYGEAIVPYIPGVVQTGKESQHSLQEEEEAEEVAQYCLELMQPGVVYFIGPGGGAKMVMGLMGLSGTLLGFDVVRDGELLASDVNAAGMEVFLEQGHRCAAVLGIIGGQGFLIGRGNRQLTPSIIRKLGKEGLWILAPPYKLKGLETLRVDTGSPEVDAMLQGYLKVIHQHGRMKMVKVR
ncbi:MAG: ATP-NAD kinase family protein [Desulfomonilia bacterium]